MADALYSSRYTQKRYTGTQKHFTYLTATTLLTHHDKSESLLWSESSLEFFEELSDSVLLGSKLYGAGIELVSLK